MNLENTVEDVLSNNKFKVQEYNESNSNESVNYLVGVILQETDGKYTATGVEKEVLSQLDNINTDVGYPRQLKVYHKEGETYLAEQLCNKLRRELDVPLDAVHIPDRFNPDEIKIIYDVHEDGRVEFVRAEKV